MTIAAILDEKGRDVVTVSVSTPVSDAIGLLAERRIGAVIVLDHGGAIAGVLSERDVIGCLCREGEGILSYSCERLMSAPAITVTSDTAVLPALAMITRKRIRHLPVVDGDTLIGIVSIGDLVKYRIDHIEQEAEAMRAYIQAV
ncbi:CBS domain-containing protein [Sphingomicrobium nitratireducens]|uniref:CBS domain-containing protein n=1 Tax=Sphingomicrobium nitratireducens TaxID=2964666 RepID=UPI002240E298|nr:CBS domain-containing protein [Sphingomicrobium nitratireducens]